MSHRPYGITLDDMVAACKPKTKEERREEIVRLLAYFIKDLDNPEQATIQHVTKRLIGQYLKELKELDNEN